MNTLIIAPSSDSQAEAEILALTLNGVLVNNYVTRGDVVAAVMHRRWDLVWFVGHGTSTGVLLSNGSIDTADLTALIRNSGAHTVVLNTCDSAAVARQLQRELGVTVIATIGAVGEPTAYQTGVLFAQNLAREMSIPAAFELARPGSGATYVMVGGEKKKMNDGISNADARRHDDRIDALTREMAQFGTEVRVLQAGMSYVQRDVAEIKAAIVGLQSRGAQQPHWSIVAAGVILAAALALTLLWYSVPR